jgi:hypothetical protein
LSCLIKQVLNGTVQPVSRNPTISGIVGSKFRVSEVKDLVLSKAQPAVPLGFMTYEMAASSLKTNTEVVRNLVVAGLLRAYRISDIRIQLLRTSGVRALASNYVAMKSLAERFGIGSRTLLQIFAQKGARILVVPLPGKGNKLFVRKSSKFDAAVSDLGKDSTR